MKLAEQEQIVMLTMHYIVSDGWSKGVLIGEMQALYEKAYSREEESPLPELPIQYADYDVAERWLQGDALDRQISYWREQLEGVEVLELPVDHPRPAVQSYRGAREYLALGEELTEAVRELSRRKR